MIVRVLKWTAAALVVVALAGLMAFLYFIPPFDSMKPEEFSSPRLVAGPKLEAIADEKTRLLAEHGREIVLRTGCLDCHATPTPEGPDLEMYLAGGFKVITQRTGQVISRNLTPDPETGLGRRTDEEVLRVLRSGVFHDGRPMNHRAMPWTEFSKWTEEDRRAVLVFLRQLKPIRHGIPDLDPNARPFDSDAEEVNYGGMDYGKK